MTRAVFLYGQDNRPYASIILQNGIKKIPILSLIDSGADMTIIPKDVGKALNFHPPTRKELEELEEKKKKGEGVKGLNGNPIDCVKRNVRIEIGKDYNFSVYAGWLFNTKCQILIGRDVFEKFDVLFKQNPHKKIIFDSNKKIWKL